jgi:hypothetical protein
LVILLFIKLKSLSLFGFRLSFFGITSGLDRVFLGYAFGPADGFDVVFFRQALSPADRLIPGSLGNLLELFKLFP